MIEAQSCTVQAPNVGIPQQSQEAIQPLEASENLPSTAKTEDSDGESHSGRSTTFYNGKVALSLQGLPGGKRLRAMNAGAKCPEQKREGGCG